MQPCSCSVGRGSGLLQVGHSSSHAAWEADYTRRLLTSAQTWREPSGTQAGHGGSQSAQQADYARRLVTSAQAWQQGLHASSGQQSAAPQVRWRLCLWPALCLSADSCACLQGAVHSGQSQFTSLPAPGHPQLMYHPYPQADRQWPAAQGQPQPYHSQQQ